VALNLPTFGLLLITNNTKHENTDCCFYLIIFYDGQLYYDFKVAGMEGKEIDFSAYKGKKILIVNTASACGYTPQYADLQKLYEKYGDKLVIIGFPANNFGAQEPGSNEEITGFVKRIMV
jgi:glutathione peroxidase